MKLTTDASIAATHIGRHATTDNRQNESCRNEYSDEYQAKFHSEGTLGMIELLIGDEER